MYIFQIQQKICPAKPEKVRSVVEVRHPSCLCNHLLEQLPAGRRHLLLQKSSLGSVAAVSYFEHSDTFDTINYYMRLNPHYPEFLIKQFIMTEGDVENQSLLCNGDVFHERVPCQCHAKIP